MCETKIVTTTDGSVLGTYSFTGGFQPVVAPRKRRLGEADILATALWLERQGKPEEAMAFLERHVDGNSMH